MVSSQDVSLYNQLKLVLATDRYMEVLSREMALPDNLITAHSRGQTEEGRVNDRRVGPCRQYEDKGKRKLYDLPPRSDSPKNIRSWIENEYRERQKILYGTMMMNNVIVILAGKGLTKTWSALVERMKQPSLVIRRKVSWVAPTITKQ